MHNVSDQAMLDARRTLSAMNLEEIIQEALEQGDMKSLEGIFCLEFDPMEAGYAS
jgi:hypothetical protein